MSSYVQSGKMSENGAKQRLSLSLFIHRRVGHCQHDNGSQRQLLQLLRGTLSRCDGSLPHPSHHRLLQLQHNCNELNIEFLIDKVTRVDLVTGTVHNVVDAHDCPLLVAL